MDPGERPVAVEDPSPEPSGGVGRHTSMKFGLKGKPSFSWRRKGPRPASISSSTPSVVESEKAALPPPPAPAPVVRSAPSSPKLGTSSSDRSHAPHLTRAQTAYLRRLLADPLTAQDNDPLAKLRAANAGETSAPSGSARTGLEQSLAAFTAVEILEGENAFACKKCWKLKSGKYHSTHQALREYDESMETLASPVLKSPRTTSPPVAITTESSQTSLDHLASPEAQSDPHISRARSTASRSSAGKLARAPSPLRPHLQPQPNNSNLDITSVKSNEAPSIASSTSVDTTALADREIDPDSDGLSNTSSSADEFPDIDPVTMRPPMPARKKSSHIVLRRAFKRYLIAKGPEVLVFHFKRFKQTQKAIMAFTNFYDLKK